MERMSQSKPRPRRKSKSTSPAKTTNLSEQEMRDAAYYLWVQEGRPDGRALDHWLQVSGQHSDNMSAR
jgi:hypothetical protein